ncbi:uracil-DNA glycosylase [Nitratifractor sp.]
MRELLRINGVAPEWEEILLPALESLDPEYARWVDTGEGYIPPRDRLLAAFSTLTPSDLRYVLFGQDPYPRRESAIGYAFIDGRVGALFAPGGLSREVNRATSLRNFLKMALVARGDLRCSDCSQEAIARIDKTGLIGTMEELRRNFERAGVLLLNTALLFEAKERSGHHIRRWAPFVETFLEGLRREGIGAELILFGSHAGAVARIPAAREFTHHRLEHPYNASFVCNPGARELFGPMRLLDK